MNNKILIGSIIAVVLLLLPSTIAMPELNSDNVEVAEIQNIINDDLPDLIVEDIVIRTGTLPGEINFYAKVKNIGTAPTGDEIEVQIIVKRLMFCVFPISTVFEESSIHFIGGNLYPGESTELFLLGGDYLRKPIFGFYKFYCTVNPNQLMKELYYFNNDYNEKHFVLFGIWAL